MLIFQITAETAEMNRESILEHAVSEKKYTCEVNCVSKYHRAAVGAIETQKFFSQALKSHWRRATPDNEIDDLSSWERH